MSQQLKTIPVRRGVATRSAVTRDAVTSKMVASKLSAPKIKLGGTREGRAREGENMAHKNKIAVTNETEQAAKKLGGAKTITMQSLGAWGKQLAMRPQGRRVQQELDTLLRQLPPNSVLVVDFAGVEMMDYSFADEALGAIFSRMSAREYPDRYIVLASGEGELDSALLENVDVALRQRDVAALVLPKDHISEASDTISSALPIVLRAEAAEDWRVAGTLPQHLVDTLRAVMEKQQVTVRELADELKIDSPTACNNRIARLHQLRLVRREAAIVPEGGRQYFYSSVI